ncbi:MAG: ketosteroid isomerase-like protein [Pseudomonadales bacterium]|jgi:ketosteroid isomerase-like protein
MSYSLKELSDRQEIVDLIIDYAQAIDQQKFDALDGLFTADAFIDYTAMGGPKGGFAEVKKFLQETLPAFKEYFHLNSNIRIHLNGDTAYARVMCFNPMGIPQPDAKPHVMYLGLFYLDKYIRTKQGWRITERIEEKAWTDNVPDYVGM